MAITEPDRAGLQGAFGVAAQRVRPRLAFFDAADAYGSHPDVAEALKHVPRDKVTVLTKTWARDAGTARADLERFRASWGSTTSTFA